HLFFAEAISRWAAIFATHPPLATRIKRLEPNWNGKFPTPRSTQAVADNAEQPDNAPKTASTTERLQQALPLLLLHSSRQSEPAIALICCLLLRQQDDTRARQLHLIKEMGSVALLQQVDQLCDSVEHLNALQQVQLLQLAMPALKTLSELRFKQFQQLIQALRDAAATPGLAQWLCWQFVEHSVAVHYQAKRINQRYSSQNLTQQKTAVSNLLALVSSAAGDDKAQQQAWHAAQ